MSQSNLRTSRVFLSIAFLLLFSRTIVAQKRLNMDENWKFQLGHAANPEKDFNYSISTI